MALAQSRVTVPEGCGSEEQFQAKLQERLGPEASSMLAQTRLRIVAEPEGYQLWVQVLDHSRTLHDGNCEDLFRAAVVVALALWNAPVEVAPNRPPAAAAEPPKAQNELSTVPLTPVAAVRSEPTMRARAQPAHSDWQWQGSLGGEFGVSWGLLPRWAIALGATSALEYGPFGLAATLRYLPPSDARDVNDKGVRVQAYGATLAGRFRPVHRVAAELGGFAYRVTGDGFGTRADRTAHVLAAGPQLGLWVTALELADFDLRLGGEAQVALLRPIFEVLEYKEVFRSSRVVWQGYFAAGYRFW